MSARQADAVPAWGRDFTDIIHVVNLNAETAIEHLFSCDKGVIPWACRLPRQKHWMICSNLMGCDRPHHQCSLGTDVANDRPVFLQ